MSQPNTDEGCTCINRGRTGSCIDGNTDVLDEMLKSMYYKGKDGEGLSDYELETAKAKIQELYVLKSDIEAKFLKYHKKYPDMIPQAYLCKFCGWWHVGNSL